MTEIEKILFDLKKFSINEIDNFKYSRKSKIPMKIHIYIEAMNLRTIDFSEAALILLQANYIVPSMTLIRSVFENVAQFYSISKTIERVVKTNKFENEIDEKITKVLLGTRYDDEYKAVNILTQIERINEDFNGFRKFYESLCEFTHPNWDGVAGSYSELKIDFRNTEIKRQINLDNPLLDWLKACLKFCLSIHKNHFIQTNTILPIFSKICEGELK